MANKATPSTGSQQESRRGSDGRFLPGNRTGGRKKLPEELVELCRALSPKAIDTAKEIMLDKNASAQSRLKAAEIILDRGYGKPAQAVKVEGDKDQPVIFINADEIKD